MDPVNDQDDVPSREDLERMHDLVTKEPLIGRGPLAYRSQIVSLWDKGLPPGYSTGWRSVDKHYTVAPGQLSIVTGWPGSGKSEWLDALFLNLAKQGWRFAVFSPENQPIELHIVKYLEKMVRKPFGEGPTDRMSLDEAMEAAGEIEEWFHFITPAIDTEKLSFTIDEVLRATEASFRLRKVWRNRELKRGLIIDPWNELEHLRPRDISETEYIAQTLSSVRAWARMHGVHVWLVAHPQKLKRDDAGVLPVPRPDAISGSQHWWNKADVAITVWRDLGKQNDETDVHIWKVRFKHIGSPGKVTLRYDRVTGVYSEAPVEMSVVKGGRND
jgi:twinkle protein